MQGGYLVVWGDASTRDLQGEYFTPATDFALDWYDERPVLYHHGLDGNLKAAVIGKIDRLTVDEVGIWAEAQLDLHKRYVRAVQRLVEKGVLNWSSGSLAHLVDVADDGTIKRWPLVEGSLTPTPAEPRRTDVQTIKSAYSALGLTPPPEPDDSTADNTSQRPSDTNTAHQPMHTTKGHQPMQNHNMQNQTPPRKRLPLASEQDAAPRITVGSEFDNLAAADMLHGYMLLRAGKSFQGVSERYANALSHKIQQAGLTAMIDSLLPPIAEASGLTVRRPVQYALQSRDEARAFIEEQLEREWELEEMAGMEGSYALLGLIPPDLDLRALLLDLYTEQVVGYYDPETDRLYVVEGVPAAAVSPVVTLFSTSQDSSTPMPPARLDGVTCPSRPLVKQPSDRVPSVPPSSMDGSPMVLLTCGGVSSTNIQVLLTSSCLPTLSTL